MNLARAQKVNVNGCFVEHGLELLHCGQPVKIVVHLSGRIDQNELRTLIGGHAVQQLFPFFNTFLIWILSLHSGELVISSEGMK